MNLVSRYLARNILLPIAVALLALVLLFAFFDLLGELGDLRPDGYSLTQALLYIAFGLPARVYELLPIATLVGALTGLSRLALASEFTVLRASGLSPWRASRLLLGLGLIMALATIALGEWVLPVTDPIARHIKSPQGGKVVAQQFRSGIWTRDGDSFINVQQILPDATLLGLTLYELDGMQRLHTWRQARQARWGNDGHWRLLDVTEMRFEPNRTHVNHLAESAWRSELNPDFLALLMLPPERMSLPSLHEYIGWLRDNKQKTARYELAFWNKIGYPLAVPVMLLLALPFAYVRARSSVQGQLGRRILIGIGLGLAFYLAQRLSGNLALLNDWPAAMAALLPVGLFALAAGIALWRAERV